MMRRRKTGIFHQFDLDFTWKFETHVIFQLLTFSCGDSLKEQKKVVYFDYSTVQFCNLIPLPFIRMHEERINFDLIVFSLIHCLLVCQYKKEKKKIVAELSTTWPHQLNFNSRVYTYCWAHLYIWNRRKAQRMSRFSRKRSIKRRRIILAGSLLYRMQFECIQSILYLKHNKTKFESFPRFTKKP